MRKENEVIVWNFWNYK